MGQGQLPAPILGAVWVIALVVLNGALCAAQVGPRNPANSSLSDEMPAPAAAADDILDMDLDQLSQADVLVPSMDTVVSTVSRQESTVGRSPAAVFVITPEMIRRSGANNIPDVLRMVPGLEVAQLNASEWAITCRGFNSLFARKMLVQIDGRAVYSQKSGGLFWDAQDVPLEDIARIEVVRGPGATVWGANAVNGVINIITKNAAETQGLLAVAGTGSQYREFGTVRYGGKVGDDFAWRMYGKQFNRDLGSFAGDDQSIDQWQQARGGFRTDWQPSDRDVVTIQGDFYDGFAGQFEMDTFPTAPFVRELAFKNRVSGENFLGRWTHAIDEDTDWAFQAYYDHPVRDSPVVYDEQQIIDLDYQYHLLWETSHNIIYGAGYRHIDDVFFGTFALSMQPPLRNTDLFSYFIQDEIALEEDRWYLTVGSKFEHNDFSGFEFQPSVRLLFLPSDRASAWAAISRAVRTPSRIEQDAVINNSATPFAPVFVQIDGNRATSAEDLLAYELGYRAQPTDDFSWDWAMYYNHYTNLIGAVPAGPPFFNPGIPGTIIPLEFANSLSGDTYGSELSATYRIDSDWEITGAYTMLYMDVHAPAVDLFQGSSPVNQVYLRSSWDLREDWRLDLIGRYVDNLPKLDIPSYLTADVRLAWRPSKNLEWAVVGRNLIDSPHEEFADPVSGIANSEVAAEVFTSVTWKR